MTNCFTVTRTIALAVIAAAAIATTSAGAQGKPAPSTEQATPAVGQGVDPGTGNLNRQQAAGAAAQDSDNVASAATYEARMAAYAVEQAAAADARRVHEEEMAAYRTRQAAYEAAQAQWQADVRACNAGDRSRCAPPPPR
jgi:hypothetical protein